MGESGDARICPVILLVVHVRLACGNEQAVLCGASSRRCKPFCISARLIIPLYIHKLTTCGGLVQCLVTWGLASVHGCAVDVAATSILFLGGGSDQDELA